MLVQKNQNQQQQRTKELRTFETLSYEWRNESPWQIHVLLHCLFQNYTLFYRCNFEETHKSDRIKWTAGVYSTLLSARSVSLSSSVQISPSQPFIFMSRIAMNTISHFLFIEINLLKFVKIKSLEWWLQKSDWPIQNKLARCLWSKWDFLGFTFPNKQRWKRSPTARDKSQIIQ